MPPPVKVNFVYSFQRVLVQRWIWDWVLKGVLLITLRYCSMCFFFFKNNSGRDITITNLKLPAVVFISVWPIQSQAKQNSRIHGIDDHQALQILEELLSVDNSWGKEIMLFLRMWPQGNGTRSIGWRHINVLINSTHWTSWVKNGKH